MTVEVTNVAELLEVSGPGSVPHAENDAGRVGSYTASSAQDRDGIVWSLSGDDAAHFSIDDPGGVLRFHIDPVSPNLFAKPPDFESASDSDQDNMYEVTVTASTTGSSTEETMNVTVEVTDVDEAGTLTLSATRPLLGTELTTTLIDPTAWSAHRPTPGNARYAPTPGRPSTERHRTATHRRPRTPARSFGPPQATRTATARTRPPPR